jgi:hypothetical protein
MSSRPQNRKKMNSRRKISIGNLEQKHLNKISNFFKIKCLKVKDKTNF